MECGGVIIGVGGLDGHRIDVSDAVAVGARRDVIAVAERHFAVSSAMKLSWAMHTIYRAKEALMISKLFLWYKLYIKSWTKLVWWSCDINYTKNLEQN